MDVIQKLKYQKSRYIVKKWESEFKSSKGVAPTKLDIKSASKRVKDAYSTYWNLKAALLEASLIDATFDENAKDCFTSPPPLTDVNNSDCIKEPVPSDLLTDLTISLTSPSFPSQKNGDESAQHISFKSILNSAEKSFSLDNNNKKDKIAAHPVQPVKDREKSVDKKLPLKPMTENINDSKEERSVWGDHLSIKRPTAVRSLTERSVSFQYSEKLFANAKFSKRNPRKYFRRNKTCDSLPPCGDSDSTVVTSSQVVKTDEADISLAGEAESSLINSNCSTKPWPQSPIHGMANLPKDESPSSRFDLLSEVKRVVIKEAPKVQYQSLSVVQALMNNSDGKAQVPQRISRKVDVGWLGRIDSDSGIASSSASSIKEPTNNDNDSSDEVICDSDEESKSRFALTGGISKTIPPGPTDAYETLGKTDCTKCQPGEGVLSAANTSLSLTSKLIPTPLAVGTPSSLTSSLNKGVLESKFEDKTNLITANVSKKRELSGIVCGPMKKIKLEPNAVVTANRALAAKKQANLEKKISSGEANRNFRRIDIQKKVFTRGKKHTTFSKYKKKQWKELKGIDNFGVIKCFKCGDVGHMARQCKGVGDLLPYEEYEEESIFPSLEEAAQTAAEQTKGKTVRKIAALLPKENKQQTLEEKETFELPQDEKLYSVQPLYSLDSDGSVPEAPQEVYSVLEELGHSDFLPGQLEAVMTVLCGKSCLVVMPTGSGKSLIYRLPALLYHRQREGALTLVISPLMSLMEDQVLSSESISVGCLHHCQTEKQRKIVEEKLSERQLSVLLVSPELLTSDSGLPLMSKLPPVSFACIDEAHCLSHWSHNFRPSYLSLCQLLRDRLKIKTLLGLTASVTSSTASSVLSALGDKDQVSLVRSDRFVPENLVLSVSRDADRDAALICLLSGSRFTSCNSVIVYCTRREECVRIAALLRTNLQTEAASNGRSRLSAVAEVYHAGLTAARRKQVQSAFMTGKTRIVVATVAFGMGINKKDLRGVIHYNMPASFENYLQEVGRAGRDGLTAHCHLFLSPSQSKDVCELKRHIYANSVDRCVLRRLLELASPACKGCDRGKHEIAFSVDPAVEELDISQEVISTLIAYLAASGLGFSLLSAAYTKARVSSYKGPAHLASLSKQCGILGVGIATGRKAGKVSSSVEFDIITLADSVDWDSGIVKRTLKNLEWTQSDDGKWSRSGLNVELMDLGFRLVSPCSLTPEEQDSTLDFLHDRTTSHESTALKQLQFLYDSLQGVAYKCVEECSNDIDVRRCEKLGGSIQHYFTHPSALDSVHVQIREVECQDDVKSSIRSLLGSEKPEEWTGRSVARILHGISSPKYPALVWARTPFWRRHLDQDFPSVVGLASLVLREMR